jgi:hypothetical protein
MAGRHEGEFTELNPLRRQDGGPIAGRADAEGRIAVGQDLAGDPAQIIQTTNQRAKAGRSGGVRGEANGRRPAETQDGHHGVELHHLIAQLPQTEVRPVRLGLPARPGLKTDLRISHHRRPEQPELALKGVVAALVAVVHLQLGVELGPPDARTDHQPALDVDMLRLVQRE